MRIRTESPTLAPLVGGILLGGSSRRMGSAKALLDWRGETFVERIATALASVVPEVTLLGRCPELPAQVAGLPSIADAAGVEGPLAGILAALSARPEVAWLVLSCDQPLVSRPALQWLIEQRQAGCIALFPRLAPGRIEPFPGIFEPACRGALAALAEPGMRASLQPLGELADVRVVPVPPAWTAALRGVNTPEELAELRRDAGMAANDTRRA